MWASSHEQKVSVGVADESLPSWLYRAETWKSPGTGRFFLWIGVEINTSTYNPELYLGIVTWHKKFANMIEIEGEQQFAQLKRLGWRKDSPEYGHFCYAKFFPLGCGAIDTIAAKQYRNLKAATPQLKNVIKLMTNKLGKH